VRVLLPILDALGAAHECDIVHRDVKPANIFLAREGQQRLQPKLLDFGIARWLGDVRATSDTGICGTPEYMSPEQARGSDHIDARSDLWNFCATLYEVLTGVVPFRGDTWEQVLVAVQSADPEPVTTFCTGDDALSAIVLRGLRRNPDERWQSASELAAELCSWLLACGFETDVCEHSLRARLVDRAAPDSGHDDPHAHVMPRRAPDRGAHAGPDGERAPGVRAGLQRWKGLWLAAAAGFVLVAAASVVVSLASDQEPIAHAAAPAALAPSRAPSVEPAPAVVPPRRVAADAPSAAPVVSATSAGVTPIAKIPALPSVPRARATIANAPAPRARSATPSASPPPQQVPPPPLPPPLPRRPSTNALNYDFGF
jgi:serine/threonine-protein kinase